MADYELGLGMGQTEAAQDTFRPSTEYTTIAGLPLRPLSDGLSVPSIYHSQNR
jgi:hypothetical protein